MVIKSDAKESKYELFSRIITSSPLTNQEIRTPYFMIKEPELFELIKELLANENFSESISKQIIK